MTEVLALRALGLGDLLASVPALRGLRRAWPGARVTLAAPLLLARWLCDLDVVDDVAEVPGLEAAARLRGRSRPDVAVNLHGRGPQSHRALLGLEPARLVAFACPAAGHVDGPPWSAGEHEVDRWIRLVGSAGSAPSVDELRLPAQGPRREHVVVHPGAAAASRRWPAERWAAVAAALAGDGHPVVVTGTPPEAGRCAAVVAGAGAGLEDRCGRDDLPALAELVGTAALVLSADTGVAHLATAFGTPSVTLFGPVSPVLWGPRIDPHVHRVLWRGDEATPVPGNPHGPVLDARLQALSVREVLDEARAVLRRRGVAAQPWPAAAREAPSPSADAARS
ncbi:glycosyltransferase family 9 protein [Fodinibacter luteus]|uniref:Glycosyltransferase family 9 protein n=1 Tax=Fodinibacter luteus TaxID=552064 RepID=A0ABP8KCW3_9MICO